MSPIQDQLKERFEKTQAKISKALEDNVVVEKAEHLVSKTRETIQKHPIPSLLAGLAIGFLIGKLLSDSKKDE